LGGRWYNSNQKEVLTLEELLKTFMNQIEQKFSQLSKDIVELKQGVTRIEGRMDSFEGKMEKFEGRMDRLDGKMEKLEGRMDRLEGKIGNLEGRMDNLEVGMVNLEGRQLNLENNQQDLNLSVQHYASEFRSHFGKIETELKQNRDAFKIYAVDLHHVKTDVEFLSGKTGIHDTKINNIEKRLEV
jgi:chromosome segregation ATPase